MRKQKMVVMLAVILFFMIKFSSGFAQVPAASVSHSPAAVSTMPVPVVGAGANAPQNQNTNQNTGNIKIWNLENADIRVVISQIAKITGKNFVIDPRVQGKVSLISTTPLDPDELYTVFLKVLQTHGFTAISSGRVTEIVPDISAKGLEIPTVKNRLPGQQVQGFVTEIISVKYTPVTQLIPILRPLLPSNSSEISAYSANNTLIISAEADKISQIEKIIRQLDQPNAANIEIIPLHYADVVDLVASLKSIMYAAASTRTDSGINIAADKNSNSVLLSGPEAQRERLKQVIQRMDRLSANSAASSILTVVVNLRYLQAKDFAVVLQKMVSGSGVLQSSGTRLIPGLPSFGNSSVSSNNSSTGASKIQVQAEPETNAILMSGPPPQIRALQAIIRKLDTQPQQVLVEAIIVEVSESTLKQLGIEWGTLPPTDQLVNSASGVAQQSSSTSLLPNFASTVGGSGVGILDFGRFKAIIRAIATDSKTNILSTPSVVVLDNQEATVKVGKTITDVTGSYVTSGSAANTSTQGPFQTYAGKEVALHLTVTPQISRNQMIRMKIDQGNDTQLSTSTNGNPDISNSAIKTAVIMRSGQILVVGGLVSNDYEDTVQQVPLLGDIPVLGKLFQYKSDNLAKKDLLVFLRPIIMTQVINADAQTSLKYNMMRELELARKKNQDILTPRNANLILPKFPGPPLPKPFED